MIACSSSSTDPAAGTPNTGPGACSGENCTTTGEACSLGKLDCNRDVADGCEVDSANDPSNCGACGKQCPVGNYCSDSTCTARCPTEKATCGKSCVDTKTDAANCGACGNACKAGEACVGSVCSGPCSETPCKLVGPQCGCAAGQACYADDNDARTCLTAGTILEGQPCTAGNDTVCAAALFCREHKVAGEVTNFCTRMCLTDKDCKGEGSVCSSDPSKGGVHACSVSCDPVAQTGCGSDTKCVIVTNAQKETYTECSPRGTPTGTQGASCTLGKNTCGPGYTCMGIQVNGNVIAFCAKYCKSTECAAGTTCEEKQTIKNGTTSYGACFPP